MRLVGAPPPPSVAPAAANAGATPALEPPATSPVAVVLSQEAIERAGIVVAPVAAGAATPAIRVPGMVTANAYTQVTVTSLVMGRVTRVPVELGQVVRRGAVVATVQSPELAEARARVRSAEAMLDAHDRERARTEKLVTLGAASKQELEKVHAEHASLVAELSSARARLAVLGGTATTGDPAVTAGADVTAPLAGTVIERPANPGATVEAGAPLVTIADLTTVWVVGDVYERDVPHVRVGQPATVTLRSGPGTPVDGRVTYIDPQIAAATRTARIRIALPNPDGRLRPGMYADVALSGGTTSPPPRDGGVMVPKAAIQTVADRQVVYVADPATPGRFVERVVETEPSSGPLAAVRSGLEAGESIVVAGSFAIRAEADRLGQRPAARREDPQTVEIKVTGHAFEPASVAVSAGRPVRLRFTRVTAQTCATEVVVPSAKIRRALPLDQPIDIDLPAQPKGELAFVCGMDMLRGTLVVR